MGKDRSSTRKALLRGAYRALGGTPRVIRPWPSIGTDRDRLREDWRRLGRDFETVVERHRPDVESSIPR